MNTYPRNVEGYLAGGQAFGPFISRNLTPCEDGELEWTFEEFLEIMRTGIDLEDDEHPPGNTPLLQVDALAGVWQDDHVRFAGRIRVLAGHSAAAMRRGKLIYGDPRPRR